MADVKQAAKWMQEGKKLRRPEWYEGIIMFRQNWAVVCLQQETEFEREKVLPILIDHLLADDWEIAE